MFGIFFEFSNFGFVVFFSLPSLKLTASSHPLECDCFLFGWPIFRGELLVLGRVDPKVFSFASVEKWIGVSVL